ncbi:MULTISPECIES: histidine phosphatase family protein [unclassified Pseudomonas]|uniref:histidine phosphatase family protein n=1 Tax=unclassified Pseudomonas TaxID=196821 RepID=UPI002AC93C25|nr:MULTISPECIES: histidine phosphatase family protein [unclassified Pseudomonas]MEB0039248.1 histidine phosphatase family protein [Pseudomonas sp. MH10]MEB0076117.1 histidine phosphatase family protein [Pseudomonas sp. MH10out]MEB0092925.1 histidine phosphatase family protein [Pseudomonas sp. CCI4.2]MEB0100083.1 histidine phosphatase family protein [Pseudomonas sp. CCI3.2]MEB0119688.1 histidine phosphatase family protein [Pseudomonas sp. CCI1.2]
MKNYNRTAVLKRLRPWASLLLPVIFMGALVLFFSVSRSLQAQTAGGTQTLIFIRHAEKPAAGLGQLNCQGLNRAIALSTVLPRDYGNANFVFASNPNRHVKEGVNDESFSYLRPLLTISPSAIKLGLAINIDFSANDTSDLADELMHDKYHAATVYTAWSHGYLPELINRVATEASGKDQVIISDWDSSDYDSLYVLTLVWHDGKATVSHKVVKQGLNNGSLSCPV